MKQINNINLKILNEINKNLSGGDRGFFRPQDIQGFFDIDLLTLTTTTALDVQTPTPQIALDKAGFAITVPKNPDLYLRVYFKGQPYNIPAFKIS